MGFLALKNVRNLIEIGTEEGTTYSGLVPYFACQTKGQRKRSMKRFGTGQSTLDESLQKENLTPHQVVDEKSTK